MWEKNNFFDGSSYGGGGGVTVVVAMAMIIVYCREYIILSCGVDGGRVGGGDDGIGGGRVGSGGGGGGVGSGGSGNSSGCGWLWLLFIVVDILFCCDVYIILLCWKLK